MVDYHPATKIVSPTMLAAAAMYTYLVIARWRHGKTLGTLHETKRTSQHENMCGKEPRESLDYPDLHRSKVVGSQPMLGNLRYSRI